MYFTAIKLAFFNKLKTCLDIKNGVAGSSVQLHINILLLSTVLICSGSSGIQFHCINGGILARSSDIGKKKITPNN